MIMPTHIIAVGGLVRDCSGRVLICKSRRRGNWEFPGGQVEVGENLEEALVREIRGETGITAQVLRPAGLYSNVKQHTDDSGVFIPTKIMLDFTCEYVNGTPAGSDETENVMWVTVQTALDLVTIQPLRLRLENMLNSNGTVKYTAYETRPYVERFTKNY